MSLQPAQRRQFPDPVGICFMKKCRLVLSFLLLSCICLMPYKHAMAFSCTSNGIQIAGTGTFTVPVNVALNKSSTSIVLSDLGQGTTCTGDTGTYYQDALELTGAILSPQLSAIGFSGFAIVNGTNYDFPLPTVCIWPDSNCSVLMKSPYTAPVNIQIGIRRLVPGNWTASTVPAGTEIARFSVLQRGRDTAESNITWGQEKTWIFVLNNTLSIPAYTCAINNPNQTVNLPPALMTEIRRNGAGTLPSATPFQINLSCDPQTTVSIQFDGATMSGREDVLQNASPGNSNVGVQIFSKSSLVVFGKALQVIDNALQQESLSFNASYYYAGGDVSGGVITSVATFTFTYN